MNKWGYLVLGLLIGSTAAIATVHAKKKLEDKKRKRPVLPEGWKVYVNEDFRPI